MVGDLVSQELELLLNVLPQRVVDALHSRDDLDELLEVVLDLGRVPEARCVSGDISLSEDGVTSEDLDHIVREVGDFGDDHRAGIERTLHRISSILNRRGQVVGVTCRVGRAVFGTIKIIDDLALSGKNILLLGRPGVGKTTMLREMARVLSEEARKRVIIVDTSNEIAGDGDVPHPAIGRSRRMQVATPARQHAVMIEAVENHMPEVIIIDEMGTEQEAAAARTIAERGVQLIATAHGNTLDNLIMNPTLSDLVGGVQTVTLGDQEARYRGTQKSVLERKAPPTFDVVVEIQSWERVAVHDGVASVVDQWLRGFPISAEVRWLDESGRVNRIQELAKGGDSATAPWTADYTPPSGRGARNAGSMGFDGGNSSSRESFSQPFSQRFSDGANEGFNEGISSGFKDVDARVFLFGIGKDKLAAASQGTGVSVQVANELRRADVVLTTKTHYRRGSQLVRLAESTGKPVYVLRKNTMPQVEDFLRAISKELAHGGGRLDQRPDQQSEEEEGASQEVMEKAMQEAEDAANRVLSGEEKVQLSPQRSYVRRLQHLLGQRYNVHSTSRGRDPSRAVMYYRT
ncbi:MAG: AAA family ATPase [SAR202 cluster bacterium Io17-Chloro-G7]|nr:MAG: AAA family ATPase [SAR202 cluster bacterium Io17-Chloro-G7]